MRDKERGVVWEETIILLSQNVRFVFLSATIPNAGEFAEWICRIKKQPCHVGISQIFYRSLHGLPTDPFAALRVPLRRAGNIFGRRRWGQVQGGKFLESAGRSRRQRRCQRRPAEQKEEKANGGRGFE